MFGFDKMFDFNRDGRLNAFERAAQFQFHSRLQEFVSVIILGSCQCEINLTHSPSSSVFHKFKIFFITGK